MSKLNLKIVLAGISMKQSHIILISNGDRYGWVKGIQGKWHFTLFIQNGRIADFDDYQV